MSPTQIELFTVAQDFAPTDHTVTSGSFRLSGDADLNVIAAGHLIDDGLNGAVFIFKRNGVNFTQVGPKLAYNLNGLRFGRLVMSKDGRNLVVITTIDKTTGGDRGGIYYIKLDEDGVATYVAGPFRPDDVTYTWPTSTFYSPALDMNNDGSRFVVCTWAPCWVYDLIDDSYYSLSAGPILETSQIFERVSMNAAGDRFAIASLITQSVWVYDETSPGVWTQVGSTITGASDFGIFIELNSAGTTLTIGGDGPDKINVYTESGGIWTLAKQVTTKGDVRESSCQSLNHYFVALTDFFQTRYQMYKFDPAYGVWRSLDFRPLSNNPHCCLP